MRNSSIRESAMITADLSLKIQQVLLLLVAKFAHRQNKGFTQHSDAFTLQEIRNRTLINRATGSAAKETVTNKGDQMNTEI